MFAAIDYHWRRQARHSCDEKTLQLAGCLAFAHDVCAAALAWAALYWLRFNLDLHESYVADMWRTLAWILPLQAVIFLALGLYRGLWRFASIADLQRIVLAAGLGAILVPLVLVMLQLQAVVPRSVLILYPIVLIFLMAGSRFAYRIWKEHRLYSPLEALGEPVLIIGAGEAGARLAKDLARSRQWRVVGLLDDDPAKQGRLLRNVSVLGPICELKRGASATACARSSSRCLRRITWCAGASPSCARPPASKR